MESQIRYARSGDLYIAYEVIGRAPLDLLYVTSYDSTPTLDNWTAEPVVARWVERLASFSRLILMDVRGVGLSDGITGAPTIEDGVDDMLAVLDAVGSERAGVLGFTTNLSLVSVFAAAHPERTGGIVLYGAAALNPTLRLDEAGGLGHRTSRPPSTRSCPGTPPGTISTASLRASRTTRDSGSGGSARTSPSAPRAALGRR